LVNYTRIEYNRTQLFIAENIVNFIGNNIHERLAESENA